MISGLVAAAALSLQLHGLSYHMGEGYIEQGQPKAYNALNLGAGIRYQFNGDWAVQAGAYRNSYYRTSAYAAADYTPFEVGGLRLGASVGLVTGYPRLREGRAAPFGGLSIRKDFESVNVILRGIPPCAKTSGVLALELGVRF